MPVHTFGPTVVECAASSPMDLAFLAAVGEDHNDDVPKLVYADWLEEQGDPRGEMLRAFVRLCADPDAPLSDGAGFETPWLHAVGIRPRSLLRNGLLGESVAVETRRVIERDMMARLRPTLYLLVEPEDDDALPAGCSKWGGMPDLPEGVVWPSEPYRDATNVAVFCAQIRLSDLAGTLAGRDLPPSGLLSFFYTVGSHSPVMRYPEGGPTKRLDPRAIFNGRWAVNDDAFYPLKASRVRFVEAADFFIHRDHPPAGVVWEELGGLLRDVEDELRPGSVDYAVLRQLLGNGPEVNAYPPPDIEPGYRRLAYFRPQDEEYWGDLADPIWFIAEDDLRAGRFEAADLFNG